MFSTSIGLILKGYEYMEHKNRLENIEHEDSKVTGKQKDETREKGKLFDRWKQTLTDIFAEKDAEM
jgi:ABC-type polar amino acid transport system ATPase subunit